MIPYLLLLLLSNSAFALRIVVKNPLAACWSHDKWYNGEYLQELNPNFRIPILRAEFARLAGQGVDIFAVAEIQPPMVSAMFAVGGLVSSEWSVKHAAHSNTYWDSWKITDPVELARAPWTADSSNHGVAIFARKSSFTGITFSNYTAPSGNSQAYMSATYKGKKIRFVSTHFDSDSYVTSKEELEFTISKLPLVTGTDYIDIIAGDFNADTNSGRMEKVVHDSGFEDALYHIGLRETTHPFSQRLYDEQSWATISHVIARSKVLLSPILPSYVNTNGLFALYPPRPAPDPEYQRILENFYLTGTDHFFVLVTYDL